MRSIPFVSTDKSNTDIPLPPVERRALFLSKVQAPPSPSAALTPKTPPESPAILHYTLPSPGLASPLAHFDSMRSSPAAPQQPWVERVDYRQPAARRTKLVVPASPKKSALPSLEQISARLNAQRQAAAPATTGRRLPAFLQTSQRTAPVAEKAAPVPRAEAPRLGRLQIPVRPGAGPIEKSPTPAPTVIVSAYTEEPEEADIVPDVVSKVHRLEINTKVFPSMRHASPVRSHSLSMKAHS